MHVCTYVGVGMYVCLFTCMCRTKVDISCFPDVTTSFIKAGLNLELLSQLGSLFCGSLHLLWITDGCISMGFGELNTGPLKEKCEPLATEPLLQLIDQSALSRGADPYGGDSLFHTGLFIHFLCVSMSTHVFTRMSEFNCYPTYIQKQQYTLGD